MVEADNLTVVYKHLRERTSQRWFQTILVVFGHCVGIVYGIQALCLQSLVKRSVNCPCQCGCGCYENDMADCPVVGRSGVRIVGGPGSRWWRSRTGQGSSADQRN